MLLSATQTAYSETSPRTNVEQSLLLQIIPLRYSVSDWGIQIEISKKDEALHFLKEAG